MKKIIIAISVLMLGINQNAFAIMDIFSKKQQTQEEIAQEALFNTYKKVTKEHTVILALELLKNTIGEFSRKAILGENLTQEPVTIEFKNLSELNEAYTNFDAVGWKNKGKLFIYINTKHKDAPIEALAALLAHEALHQDEHNSLNEETYAWTLEAAVWTQLCEDNTKLIEISHPLVERENFIKKLFVKGEYTDKYIRNFVITNKGYANLPERSIGFEENL